MNRLYAVESDADADRRASPITACRCRRREVEALRPGRSRARSAWRRSALPRRRRRRRSRRRRQPWLQALAARPAGAPRRLAGRRRRVARRRCTCSRTPSTQALGNVGKTVVYTAAGRGRPGRPRCSRSPSWSRHATPARSTLLVILGGNPVYTAPADLDVRRARWRKVRAARPPRPLRRTRPPSSATGTSRPPMSSRAGATPAPSTAPRRSRSR